MLPVPPRLRKEGQEHQILDFGVGPPCGLSIMTCQQRLINTDVIAAKIDGSAVCRPPLGVSVSLVFAVQALAFCLLLDAVGGLGIVDIY